MIIKSMEESQSSLEELTCELVFLQTPIFPK